LPLRGQAVSQQGGKAGHAGSTTSAAAWALLTSCSWLGSVWSTRSRSRWRNVMAVWPLLTPLGSLFSNLQTGDIHLRWASIACFADIAVAMAVVIWLAMGQQRHQRLSAPSAMPGPEHRAPASV